MDITAGLLIYLELFRNVNRPKSFLIYPGRFPYFKTQLVEKYNYGQWFKNHFIFYDFKGRAVFLIFNKIIKTPFHLYFLIITYRVLPGKAENSPGAKEKELRTSQQGSLENGLAVRILK